MRVFLCTAYDASTHVNKSVGLKTTMTLTLYTVWSRYDMHILSLFQSSTLLFKNLLVKNTTAGSIFGLVLFVIYSNLAGNDKKISLSVIQKFRLIVYISKMICTWISHLKITNILELAYYVFNWCFMISSTFLSFLIFIVMPKK